MSFTLHLNLAAPLSAAATAQVHAFPDKGSLQAALARWCAEPESDKSLGPISSWNVTAVTDMEGLVSNMAEHDCAATFNEVQHPHTARPRLKIHLQPPLCSHALPPLCRHAPVTPLCAALLLTGHRRLGRRARHLDGVDVLLLFELQPAAQLLERGARHKPAAAVLCGQGLHTG